MSDPLWEQSSSSLNQLERLAEYSSLISSNQLISLGSIRGRQDGRLNDRICRAALRQIPDDKLIQIRNQNNGFFVGSVDFMVRKRKDGGLGYVVLETNGGSHRGYTCLAPHSVGQISNGYQEMLRFIEGPSPLVIMGHPKKDPLLIEKLFLAEDLRTAMIEAGLCETARILRMEGFRGLQEPGEGLIILDSYEALIPAIVVSDEKVIINGQPVDAMIGDGIARRHNQLGAGGNFDLVLANWAFPVTDDKFLTYRAVEMCAEDLKPFGVSPIGYWKADTADALIEICEKKRNDGDLIIKPFQGSGGAGVHPIDEATPVPVVVEESMGEYKEKFGAWRSPFPYTVCEKVNPHQAVWQDTQRNFDLRIYVARDGDQLIPVGGLIRLAIEPDTGKNRKRALVVNLSGYGGIDIERGLGIADETLEITGLSEDHIASMFGAATVLMSYIADNYDAIQNTD